MATKWTVLGSNSSEGECSTPDQTSLEDHPASCTMGKNFSFSGVKLSGCGVGHTSLLNTLDEARTELCLYPPHCLHVTLLTFIFTFIFTFYRVINNARRHT